MERDVEPNSEQDREWLDLERSLRAVESGVAPPELRERIVGRFAEWLAAPLEPPLLDASLPNGVTPLDDVAPLADASLSAQRPSEQTSRHANTLPVWERWARWAVAMTLGLSAVGYALGNANDERRLQEWLGPRRHSANGTASPEAIQRESLLVRRWAKQIESWWEHRDEDREENSGPQNRAVPGHGAGYRGGVRDIQDMASARSIRTGAGRAA